VNALIDTIKKLNIGFSTTNQLYGIAYALLEKQAELRQLEHFFIDLLLESVRKLPIKGKNLTYIHEGSSPNNYFVSHYANFSLNVLCYVALFRFTERSPYKSADITQLLPQIADFLAYERKQLKDDFQKSVGFELVVGKYIDTIRGFNDKEFSDHIKKLRENRLKGSFEIMAFTPEGITGLRNKLKLKFLSLKLKSAQVPDTFIFNSPQLTLSSFSTLSKESKQLFSVYLKRYKGLPPFFKAEILDLFWIIDILNTGDLLDKNVKVALSKQMLKMDLFNPHIEGCFNIKKGFSIAKGFPLYDSDTTAMAIKAFCHFRIQEDWAKSYSFEYYKNETTQTYSTYKGDNRYSLSALAHILDAQTYQGRADKSLVQFIKRQVAKNNFTDKWHISHLYPLHALTIAFTNYYLLTGKEHTFLLQLIDKVCSYRKKNGLFTSIDGIEGTIEETAWALLALSYFEKKTGSKDSVIKRVIEGSKVKVQNNNTPIDELEKLWVVKEIYSLHKISTVLIQSIDYL